MSKFYDGNVSTATMQSWRVPRDTPDAEKWPTSRWFRKYHANCKTEQWRSRDAPPKEAEPIRQNNKHLEKASTCDVWKAIRKDKVSTNQLNNVMSIRQRLINCPNNATNRAGCIVSSYDVVHRIHELNNAPYERDERNWRLRIENVADKKYMS